jgi:hypothetical protein
MASSSATSWIQLHSSIFLHKKTLGLATELHILPNTAVGLIARLQLWALEFAANGSLAGIPNYEIAQAAGWQGKPDPFVKALIHNEWIDKNNMSIHDFWDYHGRLLAKRAANRNRMRDQRAQEKAHEHTPHTIVKFTGGKHIRDPRRHGGSAGKPY